MANLTFIQALARTAKHAYDAAVSKMNTTLDGFVEKVDGKGLSTNDYTTTEKNKLAGISDGAKALGETSNTAYRGDRGKAAYDHSQSAHAPANATYNDTLYKSSVASTVTVGGIAKGYTPPASGVEVKDMIDKLLHPYVAPSGITAQLLATNGGVVEKGTTQTITGVKVSWTQGSEAVMKITVTNGSTTIKTVVATSASDAFQSPKTITFDSPLSVTTDTQLTVDVEDYLAEAHYTAKTGKYTFVPPYYWGPVAANVTSPTAANVTALTKVVQARGNKSFNYTCNNQKMVYAYPKSYGVLSKILDANSFDVTGTFTRSEVTVGGVAYYVYINDASTVSSFKMTFNHQ